MSPVWQLCLLSVAFCYYSEEETKQTALAHDVCFISVCPKVKREDKTSYSRRFDIDTKQNDAATR